MNKKTLYLFLALGLPALVFGFLKFFGKNQFDIPVFYKEGISDLPVECPSISKRQYFLPDSLLTRIQWNNEAALIISGATVGEQNELNRLLVRGKAKELQLISLDSIKPGLVQRWKSCVLFLKTPWKAILIDKQKRIRGYYTLNDREELDRLDIEVEILLKKY